MQVVVADTMVVASFERECYTFNRDEPTFKLPSELAYLRLQKRSDSRACVSDEHYVSTVLAANGLDDEVRHLTARLPARTLARPCARCIRLKCRVSLHLGLYWIKAGRSDS